MILSGSFAPGDRIVQQELADSLGTSVSVVREVLLELQGIGLVDLEARLGFFVGCLDIQKLTNTNHVREIHDGLAARLCCQRASRNDIGRLREMIDKIYALRQSGVDDDSRMAARLDRQLHDQLYEIAGNEVLFRAKSSNWVPVVVAKSSISSERINQTHAEHQKIVTAIEANHADDAERLARLHVANAVEQMSRLLENGQADLMWYA